LKDPKIVGAGPHVAVPELRMKNKVLFCPIHIQTHLRHLKK
jgi:hypothetical protein